MGVIPNRNHPACPACRNADALIDVINTQIDTPSGGLAFSTALDNPSLLPTNHHRRRLSSRSGLLQEGWPGEP